MKGIKTMNKIKVTITDECGKTNTIECDALVMGYASDSVSGGLCFSCGTGLAMCLAANNAEDEIKGAEEQGKMLHLAREFLKSHKDEIIKEVGREELRR